MAEFGTSSAYWYAVALCENGNYAESEKYIQLTIERSSKSLNNDAWRALTDALKGRIQSRTGHHNEAQVLFDKAIARLEKNGRKSSQDLANVLYWKLDDFIAQNQNSKARELAQKAVPLYEIMHMRMISYETECRKILAAK